MRFKATCMLAGSAMETPLWGRLCRQLVREHTHAEPQQSVWLAHSRAVPHSYRPRVSPMPPRAVGKQKPPSAAASPTHPVCEKLRRAEEVLRPQLQATPPCPPTCCQPPLLSRWQALGDPIDMGGVQSLDRAQYKSCLKKDGEYTCTVAVNQLPLLGFVHPTIPPNLGGGEEAFCRALLFCHAALPRFCQAVGGPALQGLRWQLHLPILARDLVRSSVDFGRATTRATGALQWGCLPCRP